MGVLLDMLMSFDLESLYIRLNDMLEKSMLILERRK